MTDNSEMHSESEEKFSTLGMRHFGKLSLPKNIDFYGLAMTYFFSILGIVYIYTAFLSKLLPDTGYEFIDFFKYDYYFCYLFPLAIIPTYMVVYLNWLAMRHFEQN